jgi:hypothetical protein
MLEQILPAGEPLLGWHSEPLPQLVQAFGLHPGQPDQVNIGEGRV